MIVRIGPIMGLISVVVGCSDGSPPTTRADCPPACEAGEDGGIAADASPDLVGDGGGPSPSVDGGPADADEAAFGAVACFNGLDDDDDRLTDCDDTASCGATPYCCVGSSAAACCQADTSLVDVSFSACPAGDAVGCVTGATQFGGPNPTIEGGAFVPNGDSGSDSGLVLDPSIDPTVHRVTLAATMTARADGCGGADDCLDVVALGLGDAPSGPGRLEPDVAVVVRASRNDYALSVMGEVIVTGPLPTGPTPYRLDLTPAGEVTLFVGSSRVITTTYRPRPDRAALLYGRTHNRTELSEPARASSVRVSAAACEVLTAWSRDPAPSMPEPTWNEARLSGPSVVDQDGLVAAFEVDGDIHMARQQPAGDWALLGSGLIGAPILEAPPGEHYSDPELLVLADRFELIFTRTVAGVPTLASALGDLTFAETFAAPVDLALPTWAAGFRSPSVAEWHGGRYLAAVTTIDGQSAIVILRETGTEPAYSYVTGDLTTSAVLRPADGFEFFDDDEVDDPELAVDDANLLRLYYAGRRGSRYAIGMRVSGDAQTFRDPNAGQPILAPSGVGHDTLLVRAPSILRADDGSWVMHYAAHDGANSALARAVSMSP